MTSYFYRLFIRVFLICIIAMIFLLIQFIYFAKLGFEEFKKTLPDVGQLAHYEPSLPSIILSDDNFNIAEIFDERRYPVPIEQISPFVVKSFIAAEDIRFFDHEGIDWKSFFRASIFYIFKIGTNKQGGSTITQQLAKNILLTKERTIERKLKDMVISYEIEKKFTKKKILEMYLNTIFLGNSSYGIEAAAKNYFKKTNLDLSLAEAAMIAGLTPAPSAYAPTENFSKAKARQMYVLTNMLKHNMISESEFNIAKNEHIKVFKAETPNIKYAPY
ncbi:MAG: transglycosylase domain-containing protein, partial [Silvanigrellaceae bacterium]|nr:transglycosylase domain-containing protein [Silvanigrellaceae bacterium]